MRKTFLLVSAIVVVFAAGAIFASNMGFKLTYPLKRTAGTTGTNWVSLPYFWSGTTSQDICNDVGVGTATEVGKYNENNDTITAWACGGRGTPFSLSPGQGVYVKVTSATNWIVVGSHNDSAAVPITRTAGTTGTNWTSIPYHTTSTNAQGICSQVTGATEVGRYNEGTDTITAWACGGRGTPFSLTPGEGVYIKVTTATAWSPTHY